MSHENPLGLELQHDFLESHLENGPYYSLLDSLRHKNDIATTVKDFNKHYIRPNRNCFAREIAVAQVMDTLY
jgi:hypothetical protein